MSTPQHTILRGMAAALAVLAAAMLGFLSTIAVLMAGRLVGVPWGDSTWYVVWASPVIGAMIGGMCLYRAQR